MILYKRNRSYLFDNDSIWLKLSKLVPLEFYGFTLFLSIVLLTQSIDGYYDLLDWIYMVFFKYWIYANSSIYIQ